jgi:hypothetical protein
MQKSHLFDYNLNNDERLAQGLRRTLLVLEFLDGANMELDGEARWIDLSNEIQILNEILDCLDRETDQQAVTLQ